MRLITNNINSIRGEYTRACFRNCNSSHTAFRVLVTATIDIHLAIRTHIKQPSCAIVGSAHNALSVWKPFHSVDISLMSLERADTTFSCPRVPYFDGLVARSRCKHRGVVFIEINAHHMRGVPQNLLRRSIFDGTMVNSHRDTVQIRRQGGI